MGSVFKKTYTKPMPSSAEILVRKGERLARWKSKGKARTAPLTTGLDGTERLLVTAATYTAKYRDGSGVVKEVATGCRDEAAARSVLTELERRAERVKSKLITAAEDKIADHQPTPLAEHVAAYAGHLLAAGTTKVHREGYARSLRRVAAECSFGRLSDLNAESLERWLSEREGEGMSARTRNAYREAAVGFCNWCIGSRRLTSNPFSGVAKANQKADPRRQRRSLTETELVRLLDVARQRPLLDALTVRRGARRGEACARVRPETKERLEWLGRERALIYKTLVLTGLRKNELASLTVGQLYLDGPVAFAELDAADEKNREGCSIAIRSDLADDLRPMSPTSWNAYNATTCVLTGNLACRCQAYRTSCRRAHRS